jgi:hypothetical protein
VFAVPGSLLCFGIVGVVIALLISIGVAETALDKAAEAMGQAIGILPYFLGALGGFLAFKGKLPWTK